ncbi:MAG: 3-dehydroquinate synthase [Desulfuromonadaceae bacterium]|nr:3-dehydroquinate synthase [Desulfuromonadaceae bacterium]
MWKNFNNIILLGFMAAGKSTVGRELSRRCGCDFIDLDARIEVDQGRTIREIFASDGEEAFRNLESNALRELGSIRGAVIATGGGIIKRGVNREILKKMGRTIYLRAGLETLVKRMAVSEARPLADRSDEGWAKLQSLLEVREPFYREADLIIDTDGLTPRDTVARIIAELEKGEGSLEPELTVSLGEQSYPIFIGCGILDSLADILVSRGFTGRLALVTNTTVYPLYGGRVEENLRRAGIECRTIVLPDGEQYKNQATVTTIYDHLIEAGFDRGSALVALGGGVVGDIAGFAAATFMRGIRYAQVPTTLLSQVDSSVGGKTGINHPLGKNLIGAFHQPGLVHIDVETLKTLPAREFSAGMAEIVKYGMIWDGDFFSWLEEHVEALTRMETEALVAAIRQSCRIKAEIVGRDEKEGGLRVVLNYGHTFGHAVENLAGYGAYRHGEAVAIGMHVAALASFQRGYCTAMDVERLVRLLKAFHLPVMPPAYPLQRFLDVMGHDKKSQQGILRFVFNRKIGEYGIEEISNPEKFFAAILDGLRSR